MGRAEGLDTVDERLEKLLAMVNDWLKFAETKNAGIVGLASGGAVVGLALIDRGDDRPWLATALLLASAACGLLSFFVALGSFLPQMTVTRWLAGRGYGTSDSNDNLYYYGHLAKYRPRDLVATLARRYLGQTSPGAFGEATVDLAAQVVINARITVFKLRLFQRAVGLFAVAVILFTFAVLISSWG